MHEKTRPRAIRFGEWLVRRKLINPSQLSLALKYSYLWGLRIGDALVELRVLERDLVEEEARLRDAFVAYCG